MYHVSPNNDNRPIDGTDAGPGCSTLSLLTLNIGLLRYRLWRNWQIPINRHIAERLAAAPQALAAINADIVALQEAYHDADRDALIAGLLDIYPYVAESPRRRSFVGSGLLLLSKYPLHDVEFLACEGAPRWTYPFWMQGLLLAGIDLPGVGHVRIVNVHLAPSLPRRDAEMPASIANRAREIAQLVSVAATEPGPSILIGDYNASETICPDIYRQILALGYEDSYVSVHGSPSLSAVTWDPANVLNAAGPFAAAPPQRIDHVFVRSGEGRAITSDSAAIVLQEPTVTIDGSRYVSLSDHYGVRVGLRFQEHNRVRSLE
jgi:endonuclease/exonuclease/phosphatase family metal-dependent hydrolase